jgi:transcriptional regulator with PAS, ATPase and Fis domain
MAVMIGRSILRDRPGKILQKRERTIEHLIAVRNLVREGILVTKADSTKIMINKNQALCYFYPPEEIVGKNLLQFIEMGFTLFDPVEVHGWLKSWRRRRP